MNEVSKSSELKGIDANPYLKCLYYEMSLLSIGGSINILWNPKASMVERMLASI